MSKQTINIKIFLPDYIEGKIEDEKLIKTIENEIVTNNSIKEEYDNLKNTIYFLKNTDLNSPPDLYFNSLLPRINDIVDSRQINKGLISSFTSKINYFWKYLIPVIPVIIIIIVYNIYFKQFQNTDNKINQNNNSTNEAIIQNDSNTGRINENDSMFGIEFNGTNKNTEDTFTNLYSSENSIYTNNKVKLSNNNKTEKIEENVFENPDDVNIFVNDDEDINIEKELFELNQENQSEIINNLKNEKL
jgi:hypothetical protein